MFLISTIEFPKGFGMLTAGEVTLFCLVGYAIVEGMAAKRATGWTLTELDTRQTWRGS